MKKIFFTIALAFTTWMASAQYMVITTINGNSDVENLTDNMGFGYELNDDVVVGIQRNGDNYDLFGRYAFGDAYISGQIPSDMTMDSLKLGIGYSVKFWNNLYLEPTYSFDGDGNGSFNLGVACRF
tara:strand:+ start:176 stop:553 length:378 start_codon:yes stop_codon:yes gene_type:complete